MRAPRPRRRAWKRCSGFGRDGRTTCRSWTGWSQGFGTGISTCRPRDEAETAERRKERLEHEEIQHEVITAQRLAVIELRDRGSINDDVLRRVERELDLEELRMEG